MAVVVEGRAQAGAETAVAGELVLFARDGERIELTAEAASSASSWRASLLSLVARQERHQRMRARLLADVLAAVRETASSETVTTSYVESERLVLVSNNKTSALALDA